MLCPVTPMARSFASSAWRPIVSGAKSAMSGAPASAGGGHRAARQRRASVVAVVRVLAPHDGEEIGHVGEGRTYEPFVDALRAPHGRGFARRLAQHRRE